LGVGNGSYCKELLGRNAGTVWAYDTFDGLFPLDTAMEKESRDVFAWGGQSCTQATKLELESLGVICVEGLFPLTFHGNHPCSVSFVHVDMDTYYATTAALKLFHPLMVNEGVFMVHDYYNETMPGVRWAVDEFQHGPYGQEYEFTEDSSHRKLRRLT
jgi:hypothetical protein